MKHWMRTVLVLMAAGLISFGCGSKPEQPKQDEKEKPAPPSQPKTKKTADKPLPPLPKKSKFLIRIGRTKYSPTKAPETPPLLRWDFSKKKTYAYDYSQKVKMNSVMNEDAREMSSTARGDLLMKSKEDKTADLVMKLKTKTRAILER